ADERALAVGVQEGILRPRRAALLPRRAAGTIDSARRAVADGALAGGALGVGQALLAEQMRSVRHALARHHEDRRLGRAEAARLAGRAWLERIVAADALERAQAQAAAALAVRRARSPIGRRCFGD